MHDASPSTDLTARIRRLAEEAAEPAGLYVVDVRVRGQKGSRVIEVYVDSDEGPGLDDLAELSRELGFLLDTEDVVQGRYHLNVSSPGADRPLTLPRQYRKHVGRPLRVNTGEGEDRRTRTGTLIGLTDEAIELDVDGTPETIPFEAIAEARVQLPW